jgi:hypothetical protein
MKTHFYDSMNQGVINLSDLAYFLNLIALVVRRFRGGRSQSGDNGEETDGRALRYRWL